MEHFTFLFPMFLLLLPIPWAWLFLRIKVLKNKDSLSWPIIRPTLSIRYPLADELIVQTRSKPLTLAKHSKDTYLAILMCLLILSLSQPITYQAEKVSISPAIVPNTILVVDTALSMSLSDYTIDTKTTSRMSMSKLVLRQFLKQSTTQQVGLVVMDTPPAMWFPLTTDKAVIEDGLNRLTSLLGNRISDMGATLKLVEKEFSNKQKKNVILVSDGTTQIGAISPIDAAKSLLMKGFTLYIIAVGSSDSNANIAMTYKTNSHLIYEAANIHRLQQVAESGGGQLFHAKDISTVDEVLDTIQSKHLNNISKSKNDLDRNQPLDKKLIIPQYPIPLGIAIVLLLWMLIHNKERPLSGGGV